MEITKELEKYIKEKYIKKYDLKSFKYNFEKYKSLKPFKANENIFKTGQIISNEIHYIIRITTQYYLEKAFDAMLIDKTDDNIKSNNEGNIGSAGRIAKVWCGSNIEDDTELGCGRFMKPVRIATFPNNEKEKNIPITKTVDLTALCSHHFIPFTSLGEDKAECIVSYIPKDFVLGISKLQRLVSYCSRRMWLQEDLTKEIYNEISKAAQTEDVYVKLKNIKHGCEYLRGSKTVDGKFTSEYYGGKFNDEKLRKEVNK